MEFSGGPIREIVKETVQLPDGRIVPDFYTARMGDYALVYAVTTEGKVLVLRQYKHGVGRVCLTFPGGYVAPGEDLLLPRKRNFSRRLGIAGQPDPAGVIRDERQSGVQHGSYVSN